MDNISQTRYRIGRSLVGALSLMAVLFFAQTTHALGISPARFELGSLTNSSKIKKNIVIVRGNPSETEYYLATKEGTGAPYVRVSDQPIVLPMGQQQVPVPIVIAPATASTGSYEATIKFDATEDPTKPKTQGGVNRATISVSTLVRFTVSNKLVKEFTVLSLTVEETEDQLPIVFSYVVRNTGNVDARPDSITVKFVDETDPKHVLEETISSSQLPVVAPSVQESVTVNLAGRLSPGVYQGEFTIIDGGKSIYTQKAALNVHPKGTLQQSADLVSLTANKGEVDLGEILALEAVLKNTGPLPVEGTVAVDIEREGKRIDVLKSDPKPVLQKQEAPFQFDWKPEQSGTYTVSATAQYGIKKTPMRSTTIIVKGGLGEWSQSIRIIIGIVLTLGVIGLVWWAMKKFLSKRS